MLKNVSIKWLNILLTIIAVGALIVFGRNFVPENLYIWFVIIILIVGITSVILAIKNDEDVK